MKKHLLFAATVLAFCVVVAMAHNAKDLTQDAFVQDAEINFGAVYVLNGATTNPGNADGFLPFVMDYQ